MNQIKPTTVSQLLKEAYELIRDPKKWIQGAYTTTDESGETCFCSDGALRYSLLKHMFKDAHNMIVNGPLQKPDNELYSKAFCTLSEVIGNVALQMTVIGFNDQNEHFVVCHAWWFAIHIAEIREEPEFSPEYKEVLINSYKKIFAYLYTQRSGGELLCRDMWHSLAYAQQINEKHYLNYVFKERPEDVQPCVVTGKLQTALEVTEQNYDKCRWQYHNSKGQPIDHLIVFWNERLDAYAKHKDGDQLAIIDGCWYIIGSAPQGARFSGSGGRRFDIKFHDGREVTTYDLWVDGMMPYEYRGHMPNNAEFVKGQNSNGHSWTYMF